MVEEERERVELTPEIRGCVEAASRCYSICAETLSYSLDGGGLRDPRHLRLLIDCCEILQTTQNPMLRGSEFSLMLAAICGEACERVADSCRRLDGSDERLEACAEACDETADCCRKLAI